MYFCGGGTLLVPSPRCVGPECRGASPGRTLALGYAGDLDAGSRGSFMQAGRLIGVTAMDGVEIGRGLAEIDKLRAEGTIDAYYAGAAKKAYLGQLNEEGERPAPFEEPSPFGRAIGSGALARRYAGISGEDVGGSVKEACNCTPRPFDARDPVSGWGIYYVKGGVLLTPSYKCIAGGGRPPGFWGATFRNVLSLVNPAAYVAPRPTPTLAPHVVAEQVGGGLPAKPPQPTIVCIRPLGWWPRGPVVYPGTTCPPGMIPYEG